MFNIIKVLQSSATLPNFHLLLKAKYSFAKNSGSQFFKLLPKRCLRILTRVNLLLFRVLQHLCPLTSTLKHSTLIKIKNNKFLVIPNSPVLSLRVILKERISQIVKYEIRYSVLTRLMYVNPRDIVVPTEYKS